MILLYLSGWKEKGANRTMKVKRPWRQGNMFGATIQILWEEQLVDPPIQYSMALIAHTHTDPELPNFEQPKYECAASAHSYLGRSKFGSRSLNGHCYRIHIILRSRLAQQLQLVQTSHVFSSIWRLQLQGESHRIVSD